MDVGFKRVMDIVDRFETFCVEDVTMRASALKFLESLQVKVPQYVADWYDRTYIYHGVSSTLAEYNQTIKWLEEHDMAFNQLVENIGRFGYVVTDDFDKVYIKAPDKWSQEELYLSLEYGLREYELVYKEQANTFERQEAIKLMEDLSIKLELEEVE